MRLGLRLFLGVFLIVGVAAFFVMRVFVDQVKPGVRQAMEASLADTATVLAELAAADLQAGRIADGAFAQAVAAAGERPIDAKIWSFRKDRFDYRVTVTDARGIVAYDSYGETVGRDNSRWNDVHRSLRGRYGARSSPETPGDTRNTVMHVAAPVRDRDGRIIGVLTVAKANRTIEPFIVASQQQILRQGGWLLLLSALIGVAMTAWVARGIGRLNRYAQAVSAGEAVPPPPPRRDEIGDLGQALETMRRKLDGKEYVERYVQALTHEMKSPLAAIRGAAELLQEPLPEPERMRFARNVQTQGERLTEMIEQLLALAAVEHRGRLERREPVALAALVDEIVESVAPRLAQKRLRVERDIAASPMVSGDRFLLRQAVRNLVDNAIDFSPPDAVIELAAHRSGNRIALSVCDRGPGVPDYARDRIFERFYSTPRSDGGRSSGLGLTFVREVAGQHGGSIELRPREGGGTRAVLNLPSG